MTTITFDTLKLTRKLEAAGFTSQQAEAEVEAFAEILSATDVVSRKDLQLELAPIRAELTLLKWMIGLSLALSTGILALLTRMALG
ncbi:MAG: DUF1640 domain-containing protein [Methylomonas sp.]